MVTPGTNQNAYWRCSICGHEWPASPKTRKNGHGCPECKKRLLSEKRLGYALRSSQSLEEWCLVNSRQDMLNEWSLKNTCLPDEITYGSKKSVLWICKKCGTEWPAAPSSRTGRGDGCPACAGKQVNTFNNIGAVYPHLVEEWHSEKTEPFNPIPFVQTRMKNTGGFVRGDTNGWLLRILGANQDVPIARAERC